MKIQHKITLGSTALFGVVFIIAAVVIYTSFYNSSRHIFYSELARTAKIAGMFYLEKDELTKDQYQPIEEAFYNLSPDQKISIYDEQDSIAFDTEQHQSQSVIPRLDEIRRKRTLNFKRGHDYYHGLFYEDNQGDFVVLVKAQSPLIQNQLQNLGLILLLSFLLGMTLLILLTSWLSKLAYSPVRHTIKQVNELDLNQKPLKLSYRPTGDELEELFEAFNGLLKEIEQTYEQQKNFVDYASHELKTPLSAIINYSELSLQRERSLSDYKETARVVLQESERLQGILKNLLTFSSLNRVVHQKNTIRIDELIWDIIEQLAAKYKEERFQVNLNIKPEDFKVLNFKGNETLLAIALFNLVENAAKFSDPTSVQINFNHESGQLILEIIDEGVGISQPDLHKIAQPFYRASKVTNLEGSGLGVSIALRILELHEIDFLIESKEDKGTKVVLRFG